MVGIGLPSINSNNVRAFNWNPGNSDDPAVEGTFNALKNRAEPPVGSVCDGPA